MGKGNSCGIVANVQDLDIGISEFKLQAIFLSVPIFVAFARVDFHVNIHSSILFPIYSPVYRQDDWQ